MNMVEYNTPQFVNHGKAIFYINNKPNQAMNETAHDCVVKTPFFRNQGFKLKLPQFGIVYNGLFYNKVIPLMLLHNCLKYQPILGNSYLERLLGWVILLLGED